MQSMNPADTLVFSRAYMNCQEHARLLEGYKAFRLSGLSVEAATTVAMLRVQRPELAYLEPNMVQETIRLPASPYYSHTSVPGAGTFLIWKKGDSK